MSSKRDSKKGSKKSGNLTYLHKVVQQSVKDGKSSTLEEIVVDGPKGLSVKYFSKTGDDVDKIVIYGKDDSFTMKTADGEKTFTKAELLDELKSNKKLKFATDYAKTQKGGAIQVLEGGAKKKSSKKSSKKGSKKSSKKGAKSMKGGDEELLVQNGGAKKKSSKKASKKSSKTTKKSSKKSSKKGSKIMLGGVKKASKKASKKTSKKTS